MTTSNVEHPRIQEYPRVVSSVAGCAQAILDQGEEIETNYVFEGEDGKVRLLDLFEGRSAHLHARDTHSPSSPGRRWAKIEPFKKRMGWTVPRYSSFASDFNYDFHVTLDEAVARVEYNCRAKAELVPGTARPAGGLGGVTRPQQQLIPGVGPSPRSI